jgi:hypothetical protein
MASLYKRRPTTDAIILAVLKAAEGQAPELHHDPAASERT